MALDHSYSGNASSLFNMLIPQQNTRQLTKRELHLWKLVKRLFPKNEIFQNYRNHDIRFASGKFMELDIYVPELKLAFEYQGEQHYGFHRHYGPSKEQVERDKIKKEVSLTVIIT
jgi:hypothetical protein